MCLFMCEYTENSENSGYDCRAVAQISNHSHQVNFFFLCLFYVFDKSGERNIVRFLMGLYWSKVQVHVHADATVLFGILVL